MYAGWVGTGRKLGWGRDFTKDFSMSTKISGFRERLRKISKVYEISVSGGPLTAHAHIQRAKMTTYQVTKVSVR